MTLFKSVKIIPARSCKVPCFLDLCTLMWAIFFKLPLVARYSRAHPISLVYQFILINMSMRVTKLNLRSFGPGTL